jgi:3-isopropylmalate dehydrogenase
VVALGGDGIGREVTTAALRALEAVATAHGHTLEVAEHDVGWSAWEHHGTPLPAATLEACLDAGAVFLGAVGDPRADALPPAERPEAALLALREALGCFANLRPAAVDPALSGASALRPEVAARTDLVVVRELTGGLYYGLPRGHDPAAGHATNTLRYSDAEVERVAHVAFELARRRRRHVTSVDKANVLEVSRLWRAAVDRVAGAYPDVACEHMLVDRAAMELVLNPRRFDVLLTENLFGDILSDEAGAICGSLGVLASASLGGRVGLYEPVHGSAPDLAGRGVANPIGAIRSMALLLTHSFDLDREARMLDDAVARVLADGVRTRDLARADERFVGTEAFTDAVVAAIASATAERAQVTAASGRAGRASAGGAA